MAFLLALTVILPYIDTGKRDRLAEQPVALRTLISVTEAQEIR